MIKEEGLIIFNNTHDSIKAESIAKSSGLNADLVPVHPSISAGCGFMLRIKWDNFTDLVKLIEDEKIEYKALYYSKIEKIKREVELLYSK